MAYLLFSVILIVAVVSIYRTLSADALPALYWLSVAALVVVSVLRLCCTYTLLPASALRWNEDQVDHSLFIRRFVGQMPARSRHMIRLAAMQRDFNGDDFDMLRQLDDEADMPFQGATEREINRLPLQVLSENDASIAKRRKDYCAICLEPFAAAEEVRSLPCLHRYHKQCIDPWLSQKASCPVCKFECVV